MDQMGRASDTRLFNLHSEKWFEGYPGKSAQIFSGSLPDFFLIYKYDTQLFSGCPPEKKIWVDFAGYTPYTGVHTKNSSIYNIIRSE